MCVGTTALAGPGLSVLLSEPPVSVQALSCMRRRLTAEKMVNGRTEMLENLQQILGQIQAAETDAMVHVRALAVGDC